MTLKHSLGLFSLALVFFAASSATAVSPYANMYVFGDSLSDVGNVANSQKYNDGGRWSNGKVWNEYLAERLGLAVPEKSSNYDPATDTKETSNANNFAYGGAMTSKGTTSLVIPNINEQINDLEKGFRRYNANFKDNDLALIWGGANNLFFSAQTLIKDDFEGAGKRAASEMIQNIQSLIDLGVHNLVVLNLPDIGLTPCYAADNTGAANATLFTDSFNSELAIQIADLKSRNAGLNLIDYDVYTLFNNILSDPGSYGFTNVDDQLINAVDADNTLDPSSYLFYDDVHPTTAAHQVIAEAVYRALPEPSSTVVLFAALGFSLVRRRRTPTAIN